ncbi:hypothetical protein GCM10022261_12720 [Brevibacterium daeguense]|uniref:Inosine/uridine-preferring nucleoside hydrolase domain-containing protein n=1 Tax=Brevibacterium daeguense TaxID=909936 RepID=A0ABP8EIN5_9MICO|nr:nucleoside hydrolase [Brevibacterium daeguense]
MIPIFIDCDPGIDDAIALGYALCQEDLNITGVAASGGNGATAQVLDNALSWLALAGRTDIPVHRGAEQPLAGATEFAEETHGPTGAGYANLLADRTALSTVGAATAWVEAAHAHPGRLVGVLLGPATNLALALDLEPELPRLLRRLFVMGGSFNYRGNTHPTTEWNTTFDPEAAARMYQSFGEAEQLPVIGSLEATESIVLSPDRLERTVRGASGAAAGWQHWLEHLTEALRFYFEFHESDGHGYIAHIHDPFVLAAAVEWARRADRLVESGPEGADPEEHLSPEESGNPEEPGSSLEHGNLVEPESPEEPGNLEEHGDIPWSRTIRAAVDVELHGSLTRGETIADWLGRWGRAPNAELIKRIDAGAFLDHLEKTLARGPAPWPAPSLDAEAHPG